MASSAEVRVDQTVWARCSAVLRRNGRPATPENIRKIVNNWVALLEDMRDEQVEEMLNRVSLLDGTVEVSGGRPFQPDKQFERHNRGSG